METSLCSLYISKAAPQAAELWGFVSGTCTTPIWENRLQSLTIKQLLHT